MKNISVLYEGRETVQQLVESGELNQDFPYFIRIITASEGPQESLAIARFVQEEFPNATLMGFTAGGIIFKGTQLGEGTLVIFQTLEKTEIFQKCFTWDGKKPSEIAKEVSDSLIGRNARLMHIVCSGPYSDIHDFVEEFNKNNSTTAMVGGEAGTIIPKNMNGFVFSSEGIIEKGIIIAALCGEEFNIYTGINTAHEPIGAKHQLTKVENDIWKEVNGQDVHQWLFEQLGIEPLDQRPDSEVLATNDMLIHFPLVLENYTNATRFIQYNQEAGGITQYYSRLPQGTEFRIGYVNPTDCLQESFRLCNEVMSHPVEELFCYTCLFRRIYLANCSEWELSPYKNAGLCGAFMMGEIANVNGRNEVLNGSCCLMGISENDVYVRPDIQVFDQLEAIGEDTTTLLNVVLKRQQEATTRQNEQLIENLLHQQENQEKQKYYDFNTGLANYLKYNEDLKTHHIDKICVLKIENAELVITHLGHYQYLKVIRKFLDVLKGFISELDQDEQSLLDLYHFSESSFFFAATERMNESEFMDICNRLHEAYQLFRTPENEILVNRFVVCLYQQDPIESALNTLAATKNTQNSFLVCQGNDGTSADEEFKMIGVINHALENNGIIPHFQGIYNNSEKTINYYEALIRIKDVNGKIYAPIFFMGIAKKYHMYSALSNLMISKVFDIFENREHEMVSINISTFDIQSESTKEMIYDRLKNCKHPQNFVFEILEDEAYQDFGPLKEFIMKVRELHAKVAIDDFGAGYSNLYELSNINFDLIKVDGNIISNLPNNASSRKLLDVITHMGHLFEAKIVAEFVEDQTIQEIIEQTGIEFSQGYHFAKPTIFSELGLSEN